MDLLQRFRSSITYPIAAALVLLTVVPVFMLGVLVSVRSREHLTTVEKQYLGRQAASLATTVTLYVSTHRTRLETVARSLAVGDALSPDEQARLLETLARDEPSFLQVQILDGDGIGPFARTRDFGPGEEAAIRAALGTLDAEGGFAFDLARLPGRSVPVALLASPLRDRDGRRWGTLQGVLTLAPLQRRLEEDALRSVRVAVLDRSGDPILSAPGGVVPADSELVREFLRADLPLRLTRVAEHADGTEVVGSIAPVEWPEWGVLVERPTAEAFATVVATQRSTLALSAFTAVAALVVGFLLSRRLTDRVQDLARASSAVAAGRLGERAPVRGGDEIARLAENFNQMGQSVETLVRRLRQAARHNQELFLETIRTLAAAIDAKDPYTRGHSERVSSYAMAIARHLGHKPEEVSQVRVAAILHDVGKLGVADEILQKPSNLTDEEFDLMKRHTVIGAQIMTPIRMLREIIPGIRNHHEKWTGGGYPDDLEGEEIPMLARIIGVADAFDAMTTDRPYQKGMRCEEALERLRALAGTSFDPTVVSALEAAVRCGDVTPPEWRVPASAEQLEAVQ